MSEDREIKPGMIALRMGPDFGGLMQGGHYIVESFSSTTIDGLQLVGVEGQWNSRNFEFLPSDTPK